MAAGFEVASWMEPSGDVVPLDLPAGEVATVTHVGSYETLPLAYDGLREALTAHGREPDLTSAMWEEYWSPPGTPPERVKTVVSQPLKS